MDLSQVHEGVQKRTRKKRVGRGTGSGRGKTSTRGHKGQYASAGAKMFGPLFEGGQTPLVRKVPKRGFSNARFAKHYLVVNVGDLERVFNDGDTVTPESLRKTGLAKKPADGVRILGDGELTKKLTVRAHGFTKSAEEKIKAKGGSAEVIAPPKKPAKHKMKSRSSASQEQQG